jgi:DNA sulfur modification protein DndB
VPEYASENVESFYHVATDFLDFVVKHEPSYHKFFVQEKTTLAKERKNNANILFRPIGLVMLASLYAHFVRTEKSGVLAENLRKLEFKSPGGIFDRILWNEGRIEAKAENRTAGFELCLHLLGERNGTAPEELQEKLRKITKNPDYKLPKPIVSAA